MRAAIYARISRDDSDDELGVERQQEDCFALAERLGWEVADRYVDNDRSAFDRRVVRHEYQRMLRDLRRGHIDAVLAHRTDRLYRRLVDLDALVDAIEESGVPVATVASGSVDLNTADGRMVARMLGSSAQAESERMSERLRRQRLQAAQQGRRQAGGHRPFGWTDHTMSRQDRREVALLRQAAKKLLSGASLYSVTRDWNERGISTVTGKHWRPSNLRAMLVNPLLIGQRVHKPTGTVAQGDWTPVFTPDEHAVLVARLQPQTTGDRQTRRTGLLSGFVRCFECGAKLTRSTARRPDGSIKAERYICDRSRTGGCGKVRVNQGRALELEVLRLAERVSRSQQRERAKRNKTVEDALAQLPSIEARLVEVELMFTGAEIDRATFTRMRTELLNQRHALEGVLRDYDEPTPDEIELLHEAIVQWQAGEPLTPDEVDLMRPGIVRPLGTAVFVRAAPMGTRGFDPSRLSLTREP